MRRFTGSIPVGGIFFWLGMDGEEGGIFLSQGRMCLSNGHFRIKRSPKVNILSPCGFHEKPKLTAILSINALPIEASLECLEGFRLLCCGRGPGRGCGLGAWHAAADRDA
jgi:hypothetical protein